MSLLTIRLLARFGHVCYVADADECHAGVITLV